MFRSLLRDRIFLALFFLAIGIKLFSLREDWVERFYTYGVYPYIARLERILLGWIPFSVGDLLYIFAFIFLVFKTWKLLRLLASRQVKEYLSWILFRKYLRLVLWIYILFNMLWGLNYNRAGIAPQLGLQVQPYTLNDLSRVTTLLFHKLNFHADRTDSLVRESRNSTRVLFRQGIADYERVALVFPFLEYRTPSIKPSLFSYVGHYFGFSGYINPFSGEAQLNTSEPVFLKPFVINHEIAHQLGYGKENEASFVSFLVSKNSTSNDFRYSLYYELFFNALYECRANGDTVMASSLLPALHPRVRADKIAERQFRLRRKNPVQPYVTDFYSGYLKLNNQPKGMATYNEVIAWLIAYIRKYGDQAI